MDAIEELKQRVERIERGLADLRTAVEALAARDEGLHRALRQAGSQTPPAQHEVSSASQTSPLPVYPQNISSPGPIAQPPPHGPPPPGWYLPPQHFFGAHPPAPPGTEAVGAPISQQPSPSRPAYAPVFPPPTGAPPPPGTYASTHPAPLLTSYVRPPTHTARAWEFDIVGNWFARLGVLVLLVGAGFGFKYAVDKGLIGPATRVALGVIAGVALVWAGEIAVRRQWERFAQALTGGGIALVYLSLLAGFRLYSLYPGVVAFSLLALTAACCLALSLTRDSAGLAVMATVGGFLVPFLIGVGPGGPASLLIYVAILDLVILVTVFVKGWRSLEAVAALGTWSFVLVAVSRTSKAEALLFTGFFFFILSTVVLLRWAAHNQDATTLDDVLLSANALGCFIAAMNTVGWGAARWRGLIPLAIAVFFVACAATVLLIRPKLANGVALMISLSGVSMVVSVVLQLEARWIAFAWALLALCLIAVGAILPVKLPLHLGAALLVLAAVDAVIVVYYFGVNYKPNKVLLSWDSLILVTIVTAYAVAGRLIGTRQDNDWAPNAAGTYKNETTGPALAESEAKVQGPSILAGSRQTYQSLDSVAMYVASAVLAVYWVSVEVASGQSRVDLKYTSRGYFILLGLGAAWGLCAVVYLIGGSLLKLYWLRATGAAIGGIVAAKAVSVDLISGLDGYRPTRLGLSFEGSALAVTIGSVVVMAVWLGKVERGLRRTELTSVEQSEREAERMVAIALGVAACIASIGWMTLETFAQFSRGQEIISAAYLARRQDLQLSLSLIWGGSGLVALIAGVAFRTRWIRILGISVLGLTMVKLTIVDVWFLNTANRTVVFIALGLALLASAFAYNRFRALLLREDGGS